MKIRSNIIEGLKVVNNFLHLEICQRSLNHNATSSASLTHQEFCFNEGAINRTSGSHGEPLNS